MTLVYIAMQGTVDNFVQYFLDMDICDNRTLMKRFEDNAEAAEFANKMYDAGFDVFTIVSRWHEEPTTKEEG